MKDEKMVERFVEIIQDSLKVNCPKADNSTWYCSLHSEMISWWYNIEIGSKNYVYFESDEYV